MVRQEIIERAVNKEVVQAALEELNDDTVLELLKQKEASKGPIVISSEDKELLDAVTVVFGAFDVSTVSDLFAQHAQRLANGGYLYVYTQDQIGSHESIGLLGNYAPSVVLAVNNSQGVHYPFRESNMKGYGEGKLQQLLSTIDSSICHGLYKKEMALSKANSLNSIATILGFPEYIIDGVEITDENCVDVMIEAKLRAIEMTKRLKLNPTKIAGEVDIQHMDDFHPKYLDWIRETFGDNLVGVLLYGSAVVNKDSASDFDNIIILKKVTREDYDKIRDVRLNEDGRRVGVMFIDEESIYNFFDINVGNWLWSRGHGRMLYGDLRIPRDTDEYSIEKEMYHAAYGSVKLIGGLNLKFRLPDDMINKPGLLEYFLKLNRFNLYGLRQINGLQTFPKEELYRILEEKYGYTLPDFVALDQESDEVKKVVYWNAFLNAARCSAEIARHEYFPEASEVGREILVPIERLIIAEGVGYNGTIGLVSITDPRFAEGEERPLYVFQGVRSLGLDDVVPVQVVLPYTSGSSWYSNSRGRRHSDYTKVLERLESKGLPLEPNYLVGQRL